MSSTAAASRSGSEAATDLRSILLVGNFLSPEIGGWAVCESLAAELRGAGWAVLTTSSRRPRVARLVDMLSTAIRNRRRYSVAQVDVYSGPAFLWAELATLALRRCGRPYVLTLHGGNLPAFARRWPRRVRGLLNGADAVTAPSAYLGEAFREWRPDLRPIPNGMHLSAYAYRPRTRAGGSMLWARAFHRIYNPAMAVRALARVSSGFPDTVLTMLGRDCGDGSLQETRRLAEELGVSDRVQFVGPVSKAEIPARMAAADVLLNTSDVDNTPVSLFEAMATGLCVISTDAGGVPYVIRDGHTGLLVPRGDDAAMAEAIARLRNDSDLARGLSAGGRELAAEADWSRVLPQWETLLTGLARGAA